MLLECERLEFRAWRVHRTSRRIATHSQEDQHPICYLHAEHDDASMVFATDCSSALRCRRMRFRCTIDSSTTIYAFGQHVGRPLLVQLICCPASRLFVTMLGYSS
jgi:hypothetical protein